MASETRRQPFQTQPGGGILGLAVSVGGAYQQCRDRALRDAAARAAVHTPALPLSRAERGLRRERNGSRSGESLRELGKDAEVGVKRDALKSAHPKRREAVLVFQRRERAFHGPRPRYRRFHSSEP